MVCNNYLSFFLLIQKGSIFPPYRWYSGTELAIHVEHTEVED